MATGTRRTLSSMVWTAAGRSLAACVITFPLALAVGMPAAHAKNGDTHITGQGIEQTLDCNESTLHVMGTGNQINALGTCWAVTVMGSSNVVVADTVINDITVYGWDQTVFFKNGEPYLWDRGRELGMTNRLDRLPA
jgi:Ca2+-binding RTX toxin-like protein